MCNCSSNCNCNTSQSADKCNPKKFTSELIYDGQAAECSELASIKPNCVSLNSVIKKMFDKICTFVSGHTIQDEGVDLTNRTKLNFIGSGVTASDNAGTGTTDVTISAGGHIIQEEGVALPQQPNLNFIGSSITATDNPGTNSTDITLISSLKSNYYFGYSNDVDITSDPSFVDFTYFQPLGYTGLSFTNTSGSSKDYIVHMSYSYKTDITSGQIKPWLDAALVSVKAGPIENVEWEQEGDINIQPQLYDGATPADVANLVNGDPYEVRYESNNKLKLSHTFMTKVTLLNGESIEGRFRGKSGSSGILVKAQMFVQEL